jgi:acetyl-CoA C-acetyltransferase
VQVAARELGLPTNDPKRPLTVTGGLTFGGGPMNNYVMHGIARMAEVLREDAGSRGLVTANGGFLTKHAFGVYSSEAPERAFGYANVQKEADAFPTREVVIDHDGEVEIEAYAVMMNGEEPGTAYAACLLEDGRRTWATVDDPATTGEMAGEEFCGRRARIDGAGHLSI